MATTYDATKTGFECENCGKKTVEITGAWSTGEELPTGYTPDVDELVQILMMDCGTCGEWQIS